MVRKVKFAIGGRWPKGRRKPGGIGVIGARGRRWVYKKLSTWQMLPGGQVS